MICQKFGFHRSISAMKSQIFLRLYRSSKVAKCRGGNRTYGYAYASQILLLNRSVSSRLRDLNLARLPIPPHPLI